MLKGDIVFTDLGSKNTTEHTQKGWRPAVIVDVLINSQACTIIPFTTRVKKVLPTHIPINKRDVPVLKEDSVLLCENCTIVRAAKMAPVNESYNVCANNNELWRKIIAGLSIQLSSKYDYCTKYVEKQYRRGAIVYVKDLSYPAIILSNERNNEYSDNVTVAPLKNGTLTSEKFYDIADDCFAMKNVAILNVSKKNICGYIGYAGKKIANHVSKQYIERLNELV